MKIINKMREWNTSVKIIIYLLYLPLFIIVGVLSMMLMGNIINITNNIMVSGIWTSLLLWIVFGTKVFKKNKNEKKELDQGFLEKSLGEAKSKESPKGFLEKSLGEAKSKEAPKDRCPQCLALQTKKDSEKGHCWKCDESLEK